MNEKIAILLALNDDFVLSMKVFLLSLLKTNPWFNLDILLLSDGNLSKKNIDDLKLIYKNIKLIEAKKSDYDNCLPTTQTWGYNLYYRFDVFDMKHLGYDRIIIFDSDMVFLADITELFKYTNDFAACEKYLNIPEIFPGNEFEQKRKRFNCGLMSISKNIMSQDVKKSLIKIASEKSWSSDQPVFNLYFADSAFYLPQKFNVVTSNASFKNLKEAVILQYHGFCKPWHSEDPEKCFQEDIKKEIGKNSRAYNSMKLILKKIFDDYAHQAKQIC